MILIFQRTLAHYRLGIFREINKVTGAILCFGKKGPKGTYLSRVEPDFPHLKISDFYPLSKMDTLAFLDIFTPLFKFRPNVIITEFALGIISNYLLLLLRPFLRYRLILWSHGYNRKKGFHPEKSFLDKVRVWWMNRADAIILYGQEGKKKIMPHLQNSEKVFVAQNTLDTKNLIRIRNQLENVGKNVVKEEVGFREKYNLIYIGRLLKEKEPDRLIDIFEEVLKQIHDIELHFVGDGPMEKILKDRIRGTSFKKQVKFQGSIANDEITGKMLYASDLMVMPAYLGLSVVHSFCFDTPVVSQKTSDNGPFHGPEIEYVISGKTGFLVECNNNELMANVIIEYLLDEVKQKEMKREIRNMIEKVCSIDNMINRIMEAIKFSEKR